jgi:FkbM family methyltransferase
MVSEALAGVFRSLRIYHGKGAPREDMDALYRRFVRPGDVVFDIGAHTGDRVSSFRRIGARCIAVEPQPLLQRLLAHIHGADRNVVIVPCAVAARSGPAALHVNTRNPSVSTVSEAFIRKSKGSPGWEEQRWDELITVPAVTLDNLITRFAKPSFIKIDVEGYEDEVLLGLSKPVPALSFEFTTIGRDVAMRALDRLSCLGSYRFDFALGETQRLRFGRWLPADEMKHNLQNLPHEANSGDVYACLD